MTITVDATFENGQLNFKEPVVLADGTAVRVTITPVDGDRDPLEGIIGTCTGPRDGADNYAKSARGEMTEARLADPFAGIVGLCKSGRTDGAENHDKYLYGKRP
jgi:predicted DNA-binding antitoxin AbrB/MazE fold protein